jgi:Collagen triple helix repeat (20 copies)
MLSALHKRATYANVTATLALFFAMSGGALAASHYLITSTKQISPKVLRSLAGKSGTAGKAGASGATGATGAAGPQGPAGPAGSGTPGKEGTQGKEGPKGEPGKEGPEGKSGFTEVLPEGQTETGAWTVQAAGESLGFGAISFAIPLEAALSGSHVFLVQPKETVPQCPGTTSHPAAEKGDLCVYVTDTSSLVPALGTPVSDPSEEHLGSGAGAGVSGALVILENTATELGSAFGTWAVTAK